MTATTAVSPSVADRSLNSLLRIAVIAVLLTVLVVGSFAFGRSSAGTSDDPPAVVRSSTPAPAPEPASCGDTFHTPPC